jgi:hypothetical protein
MGKGRPAGDAFIKFGTLDLFLTRNLVKVSGPKNDPLGVKGQYGQEQRIVIMYLVGELMPPAINLRQNNLSLTNP